MGGSPMDGARGMKLYGDTKRGPLRTLAQVLLPYLNALGRLKSDLFLRKKGVTVHHPQRIELVG